MQPKGINVGYTLSFLGLKINFWRTKNKTEVDFVLRIGQNLYPVEVKNQELKNIPTLRGLRSFIKRYKPKFAFVVNKTLEEKWR